MTKCKGDNVEGGIAWNVLSLLFLTVLFYFFANFQRSVIPGAIFTDLQTDVGVSAAKITALGAAFMYVYGISQLFAGMLADKYGGYRVINIGGLLFCIGALVFPFTHNIYIMYASRVIVGIGASSIYLSLIKEVHNAFPKNFAPCLGIAMLVGYSGSMFANAPFVALAHHIGWRSGLIYTAYAMLFIWLLFFVLRFTVKMPTPTEAKFNIRTFAPAVAKRHNIFLYIVLDVSFAIFYVFQTVLGKKFLEDFCKMPQLTAGWILTITGALSALSTFVIPLISRVCGNKRRPFLRLMGAGGLVATAGVLLALALDFRQGWYFAALFFLVSLTSNMTPVFLAIVAETNPPENLGVCASLSNCTAYLLVALLGNVSGVLMDLFKPEIINGAKIYGRNSYIAVFALFTILAIFCFASSLKIIETNGQRTEVK